MSNASLLSPPGPLPPKWAFLMLAGVGPGPADGDEGRPVRRLAALRLASGCGCDRNAGWGRGVNGTNVVSGVDDPTSTAGGSVSPTIVRARGTLFARVTLAARACKGVSAGPRFRARAFCVRGQHPILAERPAASPPSGGARPPPLDGSQAAGTPLDWSCKPVPRHRVVAPAAGGGSLDPPLSMSDRDSCHSSTGALSRRQAEDNRANVSSTGQIPH